MELTFLGSLANEVFYKACNSKSPENYLRAQILLQDFDTERFWKEFFYLIENMGSQLSEALKGFDDKNTDPTSKMLSVLLDDTYPKFRRYQYAAIVIGSFEKIVLPELNGIELPDWQGNNPRAVIGLMTDRGKITGYNDYSRYWTIEGHGQVPRHRQVQHPRKTRIVYPKIQI